MHTGPLSDITVIEVAEGIAGPFCGRLLAGFGATVIKVERLPHGDWTRSAEPQLAGLGPHESGALYQFNNMGKRSVIIDWMTTEGMAALRGLVAGADILIDDWTPQVRKDQGLSFQALADLNGSLINLSTTPFGLDGPYSDWVSTPLVSLALGGYLYLSGSETREPLMLPGYQSQYLAALHGYVGIQLALKARDETGVGQPVEVSEMESLASLHQFTTVLQTYDGVVRRRAGFRLASAGIYGGYPITSLPCKDGYVTFSASAPQQWDLLCSMIGREDLLENPVFSASPKTEEVADEIDNILQAWVRDKTRKEIVDLAAGTWSVPASPILDIGEVMQDPQYIHRGLFKEVELLQGGTLTFPHAPFHMGKTPLRLGRAPRLGENNGDPVPGKSTTNPPSINEKRNSRGGLLDGIRVLDLTRVWAGPLATRIMGDFGAHVIKVSDPRMLTNRNVGSNNKLNRNKSNLTLRLDTPEGRSAFLELVAISDIVFESFRPRVMRNFDLEYDSLREMRPDIIMCSLSGYGSSGENADYPAYGTSVESITGLPSLMGYEDGSPMTSGIAYPDPVAGLNAVCAILTALRHRSITGEGQFIDVALSEGPVCQIAEFIAAYAYDGRQFRRQGNSHYRWAPHGVYRTVGEDKWIAISVTGEAQWESLCHLMERPELASDDRFSSESERKANERVLNEMVSEWTKDKDASELMNHLQARGIPAGAVHNSVDLLNDPHLVDRGYFVELLESDVGPKVYPGQAIRTDGSDRESWVASARLGENNSDILNRLLGYSQSRTSTLAEKGVIGTYSELRI